MGELRLRQPGRLYQDQLRPPHDLRPPGRAHDPGLPGRRLRQRQAGRHHPLRRRLRRLLSGAHQRAGHHCIHPVHLPGPAPRHRRGGQYHRDDRRGEGRRPGGAEAPAEGAGRGGQGQAGGGGGARSPGRGVRRSDLQHRPLPPHHRLQRQLFQLRRLAAGPRPPCRRHHPG